MVIFSLSKKRIYYVICSHVLEHVTDIDLFINEIIRVGKKGYLEFPTIYYDYLYNFEVHLTFLIYKDNTIFWLPKSDTLLNEFKPIHKFFYKSLENNYTSLVDDLKEFIFQGFEWENTILTSREKTIADVCYNLKELEIPIKKFPVKSINEPIRILLNLKNIYVLIRKILKKSIKLFLKLQLIFNKEIREFYKEYNTFQYLSKSAEKRFEFSPKNIYPCLKDKTTISGFDTHYIYLVFLGLYEF